MTERQSITLNRFEGADAGQWKITSMSEIRGDSLPSARYLAVDSDNDVGTTAWTLRGAGSNLPYTTAFERTQLHANQEGLGRPSSTRAALIPIRKSAEWWDMAQDERRAMYVDGSHLQIGTDYLPGVARKLYHARDHGKQFDFLTWFEFAPDHEEAFDHMLVRLRASAEWGYVDREIDIRLTRVSD